MMTETKDDDEKRKDRKGCEVFSEIRENVYSSRNESSLVREIW